MKRKYFLICVTFLLVVFSVFVTSYPSQMSTWHIQYNPTPTPVADVQVWNLDLFDISAETMNNLTNQGVFVMCYFSAGSWENWRPDADLFPDAVTGKKNGWPGELWLDTRSPIVRSLMQNRIDLGISKGCDGFDPDNMDGYSANTGFKLTEADSIDYYNFLSDYVHSQGKEIGLKNSLEILPDVLSNMDWAVNEQCYQYNECNVLDAVINQGKPVFHIEYGTQSTADTICPISNEASFSSLVKNMDLDEFEISCLDYIEDPICGNDVIEQGEVCDGNSQSCVIGGYDGTQVCLLDCTGFDTCVTTEYCGDYIVNGDEQCDDGINGSVACNPDCTFATECGDGVIEGYEVCDLNSQTCVTGDGYSGDQVCLLDCTGFDTCVTTEYCGDAIINGNEFCDDGSLNGQEGFCNTACNGITPMGNEIAYDGFETGWVGGTGTWNYPWHHSGDSAIVTIENPFVGDYHLRLRGLDGYVDRQVDLSGTSTAKLTFYAKVNSFESGDSAAVKVKGKGPWVTLKTFTSADSDNSYHYYEFDLNKLTSGFWIAVDGEMSGSDDYIYLDEIRIIE